METPDNLTQLSTPKQPNPTIVSPDASPQPKKSLLVLILLSVSILIFAAVAGYLYLQSHSMRSQQTHAPSPVSSPKSQPTPDPTLGWKTYSSKQFSFKYPTTWQLTKNQNEEPILSIPIQKENVNLPQCDSSNDCALEGRISLSIRTHNPKETLNVCNIFGECSFAERKATIQNASTLIDYKYNQESSIYPNFTYISSAANNLIIGAKAYLPSFTNCVGKCPKGEDSQKIIDLGKEITQILSTFQLIDVSKESNNSVPNNKYSSTVVAFEPPLSNSDYSDIRAELTTAVVEPFIDFHDAAYGKGSVVSLLISSSDTPNFPYKLIGIGKSGGQTYELLNKDDDGFWWIPTCMGKCPVSDSIRHKYVDIYKFVE